MKYLCICQCGHSRSVALSRLFHERGDTAVAIGWQTNGGAIEPLARWADRICVMQAEFADYVPHAFRAKVVAVDVGPDRWANPYHPDLIATLRRMIAELKL